MKTFLDWSTYKDAGMGDAYADIPKHGGDYAKAIAVCINSRQCEAQGKQVMCPSYRATNNPHLSTGGRVRLLKAALSSDLQHDEFFNPELVEAMALCVSCKGCKRECENNVDMPLIKAEFMAQHRARFGSSLRSQLFAHTPIWLYYYNRLRHFIKLNNRFSWLAKLTEKCLGISAKTPLPQPVRYSRTPPTNHPSTAPRAQTNTDEKPSVVLFVDTFARYFEPTISDAAQKVLTAAGYSVERLSAPSGDRPLCCGRTYLAQGMIEQARHECNRLLDALLPLVEKGKTIVGLEASCVLGLRDDAKALGLGEKLEKIAKAIFLFEEFISREQKNNRFTLQVKQSIDEPALIHGHCHQKAVGAMKSVRRVMKSIEGLDFKILDTGCCGMAGTFGLEREHVELSHKIAAQSLLPQLNETPSETIIANGFSCRQQIRNLTSKQPMHLAEFFASLIE